MIISPPMFRLLLAMVATFTICTIARGDGVHTFASADDTNFTNDGSGTPSMQTSTAQDTGTQAGASSASAAISDTINSVLEGHSLSEGISKDNGFSADGSADASTSGGISYVIHYHGTNPLPAGTRVDLAIHLATGYTEARSASSAGASNSGSAVFQVIGPAEDGTTTITLRGNIFDNSDSGASVTGIFDTTTGPPINSPIINNTNHQIGTITGQPNDQTITFPSLLVGDLISGPARTLGCSGRIDGLALWCLGY